MINHRALFLTGFVIILFGLLVTRLFFIQISGHQKYKSQADKQQNKIITLKAERGTILDRNREILAYTKQDNTLYADCRMLNGRYKKDRKKIANKLSQLFGKKPSYYINKIKRGKGNIILEKKVSQEKARLLDDFVANGFYKIQDYTRIYPYENITAHLIGAVDRQLKGIDGIEKLYNKYLLGKDGYLVTEQDARGKKVTVLYEQSLDPQAGYEVILTVNKSYQKILREELAKGLEKYKGKAGVGIIINPNTGEILSLVNLPDFAPSKYGKYPGRNRRNRAISDTYEPGSTIKSIVVAMLLEHGLAKPYELINTENGKYRIKGATIHDTHKYKKLTVSEIIEHSSNIGIVKLSDRINEKLFYKGLRDFGFGNFTEVDLPGEAKGMLKKPMSYSAISKAFIAHGYEISVTPIQMTMAYAALINGGFLLRPFTVKKIVDEEGRTIFSNGKKEIRRIISKNTSEEIKNMLIGVVENGTAQLAQLDNVLVGGKTGTSQKLINGRYSNRLYNSSFIGFLPADNPKLLCLILVDSPEIGRYGGQVAAPIFKNVMKRIIDIDLDLDLEKKEIRRSKTKITKLIADTEKEKNYEGFLNPGSRSVKLHDSKLDKLNLNVMPDLKNKSMREAIAILSKLKIKYKVVGNGKVVEQSIKAGTKLTGEMTCVLKCKMNNVPDGVFVN